MPSSSVQPSEEVEAPLRILYVVSRWREPTETFIRREVDAARAAGDEVIVLSLKKPAPSAQEDPRVVHQGWRTVAAGVIRAILRRPMRTLLAVGSILVRSRARTLPSHLGAAAHGLAAEARLPRVDWIHAHFAWVATTAAFALARHRGQRYSTMIHAFDVYDERVVDRFLGHKLHHAAFVAVESERIRSDVEASFGCDPFVLRMGVPKSYLAEGRRPAGASDRALVLSVGSLVPKKGHDVLIRAAAGLPDHVELKIIGEGPQRAELEALTAELGVGERAELLGALTEDEVRAWLDRASVFALASRLTPTGDRDGVPNVLIEAMARGAPVVATATSGLVDLLEGRAMLVEPEDPAALAAALGALLGDEARRQELGSAARSHIEDAYTTERNYQHLRARITAALKTSR